MTTKRFTVVAMAAASLASLAAWLLPGAYAQVMHPLTLVTAGGLALWVSAFYQSTMRAIFLCLAVFLVLYAPTASSWLLGQAAEAMGGGFLRALLVYQFAAYAFLLAACVLILRMVDVRRLRIDGWLVSTAVVVMGVAFVLGGVPTFRDLWASGKEAGTIYLAIRTFDALVMSAMAPVLWLYVRNARSRYQESLTFSLTALGIVLSLVLVYLYELVQRGSLIQIAAEEYQQGSALDALYLFGYLTIAIGLFAHRKHQEWSLKALDRVLA